MFRDRVIPRRPGSVILHFVYTVVLGLAMWAFARAVLVAQAYFLLAPADRFPVALDGYTQAPPYFWHYVNFGAIGLGVVSWFLLWYFFNVLPFSWRAAPFLVRKFLLWWGVGLFAGALVGYTGHSGHLEPFLDSYLPFIWEKKEVFRPGQVPEIFLPPMAEDAYVALAGIALQLGVAANAAFYVLRAIYYGLLSLRQPDESVIQVIIRGRPVRREG